MYLVVRVADKADEFARQVAGHGFIVERLGNELRIYPTEAKLQLWWLVPLGLALAIGIPITAYYLNNENEDYLVGSILATVIVLGGLGAVIYATSK